ncbi:MAG: hypothetical protein ACE5OP_05505 [Candidatus Glassbacteria bacterium]
MRVQSMRITMIAAVMSLTASGWLRSQPSDTAVVNHFVSDPKQNTVLFITDFDGSAPDVTVYFYSNEGNIVGSKNLKIPRNSTVPVRPHDVVKRKENGNIRIMSKGGGIVAEYWQLVKTDEAEYSVAVPAQPAGGHSSLILQHYVSDPDLNSVIFLTNPNESQASVTLEFNDKDGNLLGNATRTIAPNATLRVRPHDVLSKKAYGNVHIKATGAKIVGEYWQQEDQKVKDPKTGKTKEARYTVAIPIQSISSF